METTDDMTIELVGALTAGTRVAFPCQAAFDSGFDTILVTERSTLLLDTYANHIIDGLGSYVFFAALRADGERIRAWRSIMVGQHIESVTYEMDGGQSVERWTGWGRVTLVLRRTPSA